jgi:hypothetical protein
LSKVRDQTWDLLFSLFEKSTIKEIFEQADKLSENGFNGLAGNFIFADYTNGDIGYMVTVAVPVRKDKTPYIGSRVLDGT